ncbi:NADH-quinone oxidoreductase subunit NuoK [Coxiella endosymbiont of Amblyomma americanum]|uniref:NADH-quinone oxidoreductase subunit NuoK n=1 Tax=Coxiella endosymbiont of Amblyomma americanum TaxID=325775 RepID=UPI00057EB289|nr:NADH-quinone oxidoreductase subunit NuoK [Coxiella endosymbiont of Amblyomma americanum]AJC50278.1 NADH-quinone oxidoreductase subunit K [Coxiella endosymbiont of Amblyomma americanum]AUJ58632.1 NADH-quinone oxidoreductase subunit K [Coxiella-like endosymbiont of Amblyomma americanum]
MIPLSYILTVSAILFSLGFAGIIINRKNLIVLLMCTEMILLAVDTNFIAFAQYLGEMSGELFALFILTVSAAESAIGLAILVLLYRLRGSISIDVVKSLKG